MINLIVAMAKNRVIGNDSAIPWRIKGEQKSFKEITSNGVVIMGRITYDDIGRPLPNRENVVISRKMKPTDNIHVVESPTDAIVYSNKTFPDKEIYIIGGQQIYQHLLPYTNRIYISVIDKEYSGNILMPKFENDFSLVNEEKIDSIDLNLENNNEVSYNKRIYDRI